MSFENDLESTVCPLCNSADSNMAYAGKGFAPYSVMRCAGCSFHYLSPRLKEAAMLACYEDDRYFEGEAHGYGNYADQETALRATFRRLLKTMARRGVTGGTLLEIGCGYGYLLDEARPYFDYRVGADFSAAAVRAAKVFADAVYQGGVDAIPDAELFDCVIATHVVEHVYHPREFIDALLKHVRPGGCLLVATPDMGSFWRVLMGRYWPSFKLPEHVLYFEKKTLTRLLTDCGVQGASVVPYPHAFPLPLVAAKLRLKSPALLNKINLWLPATTLAIAGFKNNV